MSLSWPALLHRLEEVPAGASQWNPCVRLFFMPGSLSIMHAHLMSKNTHLLSYSLKPALLQKQLKIPCALGDRPTLVRLTTPTVHVPHP